MAHVGVLGAGAWGTALAKQLADKGNEVWLWARPREVVDAIEQGHVNTRYLPGVALPASLHASQDPERVLRGASMVLLAVPSHAMRAVLEAHGKFVPAEAPIVSATKGIENDTLALISEITRDTLGERAGERFTCLSGPSFAQEVVKKHPTAVVVAGRRPEIVQYVQRAFSNDTFRAYSSDDLCGVEFGGALKNVVAIAAGASDGLGFGSNSRAALITRGLAEIARVAVSRGANPLTVAGLAGMGDLVLTCTGELSRNRTVGLGLGRGQTLDETLKQLGHVAEGVKTAKSAYELATRTGVDMPIAHEVYCALYEGKPAAQAVQDLMRRELRPEFEFV